MAIAVTNIGIAGASSADFVIIHSVTVPSGALIVAVTRDTSTAITLSAVDDGGTNTYTRITTQAANSSLTNGFTAAFYAWNITALSAADLTYTLGQSTKNAEISAFYATGIQTSSSPLDTAVTATATGTGTSPSVTSGTPAVSGELFVGTIGMGTNVATFTQPGGGWATPPVKGGGSGPGSVAGGNLVNSGTTTLTYAPTTSSSTWGAIIFGFKPAAVAIQLDYAVPQASNGLEQLDEIAPVEEFATVRLDRLAPLEILVNAQRDGLISNERRAATTADRVVSINSSGNFQRDSLTSIYETTNLRLDRLAPIEWRTGSRNDEVIPMSVLGATRSDEFVSLSEAGNFRRDFIVANEAHGNFRLDYVIPLWWNGIVQIPIQGDILVPIYWTRTERTDEIIPLEETANIRLDELISSSNTGNFVTDKVAPVEFFKGILNGNRFTLEELATSSKDTNVVVEFSKDLREEILIPLGNSRGLTTDAIVDLSRLGGIRLDVIENFAYVSGRNVDWLARLEWRENVKEDSNSLLSLTGKFSPDTIIKLSSGGNFILDTVVSLEKDLKVSLDTNGPISFLAEINSIQHVRVNWDGSNLTRIVGGEKFPISWSQDSLTIGKISYNTSENLFGFHRTIPISMSADIRGNEQKISLDWKYTPTRDWLQKLSSSGNLVLDQVVDLTYATGLTLLDHTAKLAWYQSSRIDALGKLSWANKIQRDLNLLYENGLSVGLATHIVLENLAGVNLDGLQRVYYVDVVKQDFVETIFWSKGSTRDTNAQIEIRANSQVDRIILGNSGGNFRIEENLTLSQGQSLKSDIQPPNFRTQNSRLDNFLPSSRHSALQNEAIESVAWVEGFTRDTPLRLSKDSSLFEDQTYALNPTRNLIETARISVAEGGQLSKDAGLLLLIRAQIRWDWNVPIEILQTTFAVRSDASLTLAWQASMRQQAHNTFEVLGNLRREIWIPSYWTLFAPRIKLGRGLTLKSDTRATKLWDEFRTQLLPPESRATSVEDSRFISLLLDTRGVILPSEETNMDAPMLEWSPASTQDNDYYYLLLSGWVLPGETVQSPAVTVDAITGDTTPLLVGSVAVDTGNRSVRVPPGVLVVDPGPRIQVKLSGGKKGNTYTTHVSFTTNTNRTISRPVLLSVQF